MRNTSDNHGDRRPTLPSIRDLFRGVYHLLWRVLLYFLLFFISDELSGRYNSQVSSSSVHPLPTFLDPGQGHPLSSEGTQSFIQHHNDSDALAPTFYQASIPGPYTSPHETQGPPSLHSNGLDLVSPYRTSNPTPSADYLPSTDSLGRQGRSTPFPASSDEQAFDHERYLGASYITFRLFQPSLASQPYDENARYECQYCGKAFSRPSTLRVNL